MKALLILCACLPLAAAADIERWRTEVRAAECAFAASMAQRDLAGFARHLDEGAMFFAPGVLRGKAAVVEGWKPWYEGPQAPFSWSPDRVEPLADGSLAYSTGLVRDPAGRAFSRFTSVWKQVAPGQWRVLIDNGVPLSPKEREEADKSDARPC